MSSAEVTAQRRITAAFIATDPLEVVLVPRSKVPAPAGGFTWQEQAPRDPQTMRLVAPRGQGGPQRPTVTVDGIQREVDRVLLASWDAVAEPYDVFTLEGDPGATWEVLEVQAPPRAWDKQLLVSRVG